MDIIRSIIPATPFVIGDANLISSNVTESEYTAFSTTGAVAAGDRRQVVSPTAAVTFTIASPCVMTWTQSQLPDNTAITFTTSGALPTGIVAGTVYFVRRKTDSTYNLARKPNGAGINTGGSQSGTHTAAATRHDVYEALLPSASGSASSIATTTLTVGGTVTGVFAIGMVLSGTGVTANTTITAFLTGTGGAGTYTVSASQTVGSTAIGGHAPVTNTSYWARADSTNRWRMHDSSASTQTANVTSITNSYQLNSISDTVALLNIDCTNVNVTITDAIDGEVYNDDIAGVEIDGITDYYKYCFEPIVRKSDILFSDLPKYPNAIMDITITTATGQTALCGVCYIGHKLEAGVTGYGMQLGIQDYSVKTQDDFGNYQIVERSYSRKVSLLMRVDNEAVDALHNFFAGYRSIPAIYIGATTYGASYVFGFYKEFNIEIPHNAFSVCSIEIEGLT